MATMRIDRNPNRARRARLSAATAALAVSACAGSPPPASPSPGPPFAAERFFAGRLEGVGRLAVAMRAVRTVHVASAGRVGGDGVLVLDQRVDQTGAPPRDRRWAIRPLGGGRYAGTLTDASGPVTGEAQGNILHLAYPMPGGLRVEQWLTLAPDGMAAQNHMVVRKLGVVVARLDETIRKLP